MLLTRNLISAPETEWDALFAERDAILKDINGLMHQATDEFMAEILKLEEQLQARISGEVSLLKKGLVANYHERQGAAGYLHSASAQSPSDSIAC
ncbi:MAG: hypothetical protein JNK63_02085 [Chthonomonas sp.]|nr:hypothetical protein [Chthonomonas sp.]